jgi:hypothetical protein
LSRSGLSAAVSTMPDDRRPRTSRPATS